MGPTNVYVLQKDFINYEGVQSWKDAHLPTLEIREKQKGNRVKKREKWGKKRKNAATGNRTRDPSKTDQMSVLTNQVNLKMQLRHRFDQKCPFTDSLHWLDSHLARTSSVPLEKSSNVAQIVSPFSKGKRNDALQGNLEKKKNARFYFLLLGRLFNIGLQIRLVILKFLRAIC